MKLVRCENGHFYHADMYDKCPHCYPDAENKEAPQADGGAENHGAGTSEKPGFAVGWLVAVDGKHYGEDFRLKAGDNTIGRFADMDIRLVKDIYISRNSHAVLFYDAKINEFLLRPGTPDKLVYLNGTPIREPRFLKAGDRITLGKTTLMFVPCCTDSFKWQ